MSQGEGGASGGKLCVRCNEGEKTETLEADRIETEKSDYCYRMQWAHQLT